MRLARRAIFLISAAAISYEILLVRLLGIIQWHHFASMIISLALLGYGASGAFVALLQKRVVPRFRLFFLLNACAFALSMTGCFLLAQRIPFNPLEIFWDSKQLLYLCGLYFVLAVPFFCAANCICITLACFRHQIHRIYRFDLAGAGAGALAIVALLHWLPPLDCLRILGAIGFCAAAMVLLSGAGAKARRGAALLGVCALLLPLAWPADWLSLKISEYKGLRMARRVPESRIISENFGPLGWIAVLKSPRIPLRYAPGLSLNCPVEPPPQLGIFTDGDAMSPITRYNGNKNSLAHLDWLSAALPYHLLEKPRVLILGAGGGMDVLTALYHRARTIDAVEVNRQVAELVRRTYADFAGRIYNRKNVALHIKEARGFVAGCGKQYGLIQISLLDSFQTTVSGAGGLAASYLYTLEGISNYLEHLEPGGFLAVSRWVKVPPRDSLKLFATVVKALEAKGVKEPAGRMAMIRSWQTTTLVVKNGSLTSSEVAAIKAFCRERSFDTVYFPGIKAGQSNRYNVLEEPYFYRGVKALLGENRSAFLDGYKFNIKPASDDRPYFFHFFKWSSLPEIWSLREGGGLALLEWGYPILLGTLGQALLLSFALVALPLLLSRAGNGRLRDQSRRVLYFIVLGLAFLFVEIACIQKLILFLHHPVYAVSVALCAFLVFAGLGSGFSPRWERYVGRIFGGGPPSLPIVAVLLLIGLIGGLYAACLSEILQPMMALGVGWKFIISILLLAPLAFCMGMPFPLGLSRAAQECPEFIPWAWGLNGCASVLSAVLATILALHWGFSVVMVGAVLLYGLAAWAIW